ncbi:MAG: DUF3237 family protein [Deltaproteobacteria bacterium]|nr:DUF3237 family protein [Deltaproteobacteria bacterium]
MGDDYTVVPDASWTCGASDGIAPPNLGQEVFRIEMVLGDIHNVGVTQFGERRILDVTGGTFSGTGIDGLVIGGSLDLELTLSNGSQEVEDLVMLRGSDETRIFLRICGFSSGAGVPVRFVPSFEVENTSTHAWLNSGDFAGIREVNEAAGTIALSIYDMSNVPLPEPKIQLQDPQNTPHQQWECYDVAGGLGAEVFSETVTLADAIAVGASKLGTRNIIPITGGVVSGQVTGEVLFGGADFQLITNSSAILDARYTLAADNGEFILVRNCGPFGALVPTFETRADGPYAFLNENRWMSSNPGGALDGVSITFYERN